MAAEEVVEPWQQPQWASDPVWAGHVNALAGFPRGLSILELCGGASTACLAAELLLGRGAVRLSGFYDTDPECRPMVRLVHGSNRAVCIGSPAGDILRKSPNVFPPANAVISGPPCPPWSSVGARGAFDDLRARVFVKVVDIIVNQSRRRSGGQCPLMFFVLENVEGFTHRLRGEPAASDVLLQRLRVGLAGQWHLDLYHLNTADFGLPQSRRRVYLVGRSAQWFANAARPVVPHFVGQCPLGQLLDVTDQCRENRYTATQQDYLRAWKRYYEPSMVDRRFRGQFALVDLSRCPDGRHVWGTQARHENTCQCLTASGPMLHVFSLGEQGGPLTLDRRLRVRERGALQGFPQRVCRAPRTEVSGTRVFGNSMSVPVIGSVLASVLQDLNSSASPGTLRRVIARSRPASVADLGPFGARPRAELGAVAQEGVGSPRARSRSPPNTEWGPPPSPASESEEAADRLGRVAAWGRRISAHWSLGLDCRAGGRPSVASARAASETPTGNAQSASGGVPDAQEAGGEANEPQPVTVSSSSDSTSTADNVAPCPREGGGDAANSPGPSSEEEDVPMGPVRRV